MMLLQWFWLCGPWLLRYERNHVAVMHNKETARKSMLEIYGNRAQASVIRVRGHTLGSGDSHYDAGETDSDNDNG